jgi:hypothetical protein
MVLMLIKVRSVSKTGTKRQERDARVLEKWGKKSKAGVDGLGELKFSTFGK